MVHRAFALALALLALSCCSSPEPASEMAAADRTVVLISMDGLAAYYFNDPQARMPTLRRLAAEGAVAEGMRCSFPTVTWPNHTTLVTGVEPGRHGVIGNSYFDRQKLEVVKLLPDPLLDKDEIVKVPTIYDLAHQAGLKTAGIIWPASRNAKTLDWTVPDCGTKELWDKYGTKSWLDELRQEGIPVDMQEPWVKGNGGVQRDWMYARATAQVIQKHKPNLVLLHLIEADHAEHAKGPRTPDAYWACSHIDDRVRDVVEAIDAAGLRDRTTFFLVSDHGFMTYTKNVNPNVRLRKEGLIKMEGDKIGARQAYVLSQGGGAFVYVVDKARRAELIPRLRDLLSPLEGVQGVFEEKEYAALGLATTAEDPRMPDLVMGARDGYSFSDTASGDEIVTVKDPPKGTHGYLQSDPQMYATFIASGAGIRRGVKLGVIRNVDVAPTLARLLGLKMRNVEGRVLEEILDLKK